MKASTATMLVVAKPDRLSRGESDIASGLEYAVMRQGGAIGYADGTSEKNDAAGKFHRRMRGL